MKFVSLHTKNTAIIYKNALCSSASLVVLVFVMLSVMIPLLLVSLLSPYSGIAESRVLYEQPRVQFKYKSIFVGDTQLNGRRPGLVACSTFPQFLPEHGQRCEGVKYWTQDLDRDGTVDKAYFELQLEHSAGETLSGFDLVLFFEAKLKHKCSLSPPAMLAHRLVAPAHQQLSSGEIRIKAELQLKQYIEFTCPFPGRNTKTHFHEVLPSNASGDDMEQFRMDKLLARQLKANPAFFQLDVQQTYLRRDMPARGLRIKVELDILQVAARYHLSVWERLGQFWLYFASFFGISFYVMNKLKDFLFGRHIIRSFEIIPWKKLY